MRCKTDIGKETPPARPAHPTSAGSVAAEFALVAPLVILIAAGTADFGMLAARSAALVATTRIGAEFARAHPLDAQRDEFRATVVVSSELYPHVRM